MHRNQFRLFHTFLHSMVCLSSVTFMHICAPCLSRLMDLDTIWHVYLCGKMTHCVRWVSLTPWGRAELRSNPQRKHVIASCSKPSVLSCHLANTNEELSEQRFNLLSNYFGLHGGYYASTTVRRCPRNFVFMASVCLSICDFHHV